MIITLFDEQKREEEDLAGMGYCRGGGGQHSCRIGVQLFARLGLPHVRKLLQPETRSVRHYAGSVVFVLNHSGTMRPWLRSITECAGAKASSY